MTKYLMTQRRHMALLLALLMVLAVTMTGFVWNEKTVTVAADGQSYTVKTHLNSTDGILRDAGIPLGKADKAILSTPVLQNGTVITVLRAFPVNVTVNGQTKQVQTTQTTAQGLADELGYEAPNYEPLGNANEALQADSSVSIAHITSRSIQNSVREVGIETVRQPDDKMIRGEEELLQSGSPGSEEVQETIFYENGKEVKRQTVTTKVLAQMQPRIVKEGTRDTVETSRGAMRFRQIITMEASAYLPGDGDGRGITASGMRAVRGVVAVDPAVIPLGTRLYIPGYGMAIAADTGGAIQGNRIDLLMESYGEAMAFGRQSVEVYVL